MSPTPLKELARVVSSRDAATQKETFVDCLRFLALGKLDGTVNAAVNLARSAGRNKCADILESGGFHTRTAVAPGSTIDGTFASPLAYAGAAASWIASLSNSGAFDALLASGAMRVMPLNTRIGVTTLSATGSSVGESSLKVISNMSFASDTLAPKKATAVCVVSAELLKMFGTLGSAVIDTELRTAVALESDRVFLAAISSGATSTASVGSTIESLRYDLGSAWRRMTTGSASRLYAIVSPEVFKTWAVMPIVESGGAPIGLFSGLGTSGIIKILVSDAVGVGVWYLVDASQIAAGTETVEIDSSNAASLQVDTAPDSPPTTSTIFTSMYQSNCVAVKCERWLSAVRLRASSCQVVTGADYVSSPP